jgi:hypothetical protein
MGEIAASSKAFHEIKGESIFISLKAKDFHLQIEIVLPSHCCHHVDISLLLVFHLN